MFNFLGKDEKSVESSVEQNREEILTLPMNIAMFGWELVKIKAELFHIHAESGKRLVSEAQAVLAGDEEKLSRHYEDIYSGQSINSAKKELDAIKKEIEETIQKNLFLFQQANFLLKERGGEEVDLSELQIDEGKIEEILTRLTTENIYDKLGEYREYLDGFLDKAVNICNTLPFQLNQCLFV